MRKYKNNISFNVRNITLNHKIITFSLLILILSFINITLSLSSNNVSALSYQSTANIGFTFNPTLSISISDDLVIPSLTPSTAADSNVINVAVATNTSYGYSLTANVGNSTYNNRNLNLINNYSSNNNNNDNNNNDTNTNIFTSLDYGSAIESKDNFTNNTWGYSYSLDNSTTWQSYSGLPLYSDNINSTTLFNTYGAASSKTIDFKIAAKASSTQPAGEYSNIINFYAVSNPEPPTLYDTVKYMTKGTLAENNVSLSDTITQANSGVYTYDPNIYGIASDASNDYNIYFYRGILDSNLDGTKNTYGSNGDGLYYPNYVKLGDTCWRIVRTTGSGGTKMIYNGLYSTGTNVDSCANMTNDAQIATLTFATKGNSIKTNWYKNINRVGYTFNNLPNDQDKETPIPVNVLFGDERNFMTTNTKDSNVKDYIENNWFLGVLGRYVDVMESSAGYCNDRSIYDSDGNLLAGDVEIITPYANAESGITLYYFGAQRRNMSTFQAPSLSCPRTTVDIYTTNNSSGGNKQLVQPVALLTADEASFAGSGSITSANGSGFNYNSYLRSGSYFWLLSPRQRYSNGYTYVFFIEPVGHIDTYYRVSNSYGVRPVISLMHHIQVTGGTGTATSPWTIE